MSVAHICVLIWDEIRLNPCIWHITRSLLFSIGKNLIIYEIFVNKQEIDKYTVSSVASFLKFLKIKYMKKLNKDPIILKEEHIFCISRRDKSYDDIYT